MSLIHDSIDGYGSFSSSSLFNLLSFECSGLVPIEGNAGPSVLPLLPTEPQCKPMLQSINSCEPILLSPSNFFIYSFTYPFDQFPIQIESRNKPVTSSRMDLSNHKEHPTTLTRNNLLQLFFFFFNIYLCYLFR